MGGVRAGVIGFSAVLAACTALTGLADITAEGRPGARAEAGIEPGPDGRSAMGIDGAVDPANPIDGASAETGAPRSGKPGVTCGTATCTGDQHCCRATNASLECTTSACSLYDYACDDPFDCPEGQVCCGTEANVGVVVVVSSRCSASCSGRVLCATGADCGEAGTCSPIGSPAPESLKGCAH
jgi:hypothetical protein